MKPSELTAIAKRLERVGYEVATRWVDPFVFEVRVGRNGLFGVLHYGKPCPPSVGAMDAIQLRRDLRGLLREIADREFKSAMKGARTS